MKTRNWLLILTLLTTFFGILTYYSMPKSITTLENTINDAMFAFRGELKKDDRIIIIDIDERSLKELGQWPWSRNILAKILDNLTDNGIVAIGFDMIFTEYDKSSPSRVLKDFDINSSIKALDYDEIFAKSIKNSNTIMGYFFTIENDGTNSTREPKTVEPIVEFGKLQSNEKSIAKAHKAIFSIDKLNDSAYSNGFINYSPKIDKSVRDVPGIIEYMGVLYPSLSLEILHSLTQSPIYALYNENALEALAVGGVKIPTDIYGNIKVNFTGKHPAYRYISAVDIYNNSFKKELISGKIALIGTSAPGLFDIRSTPFDATVPGVEIHAHLIDNILNENFISQPQWTFTLDLLFIALLPILCFFIISYPKIFISNLMGVGFLLFILAWHYVSMFYFGTIFHITILLIETAFMFFVGGIINYFFENRQKEFIKAKFANKVSREVMEDIVKDSNDLLRGDMKEISIFFSDIRGFTTISEGMESPIKLIEFLNSYMTPMTDIIIKNQGTVDKFIGDAIMAYWNAPRELENHADFAIKSAIEQIQALKELNKSLKEKNLPNIDIGIGLNVGDCIVGEMGSQGRSDYTCIGDSVNLASRLESLNKKYKTNIILSEYFLQKLSSPEAYIIEELGDEVVKGKSKSVKIFTCKGYSNLS